MSSCARDGSVSRQTAQNHRMLELLHGRARARVIAFARSGAVLRGTFPCSLPCRCESGQACRKNGPGPPRFPAPPAGESGTDPRRHPPAGEVPWSPNSVRGADNARCSRRNSVSKARSASTTPASPLADHIQMLEGRDTHQFGGMRRNHSEQVVQPPMARASSGRARIHPHRSALRP